MNHVIIPAPHRLSPLIPAIEALVLARGGTTCDRYELEDTILRAGGFAWDIGAEAAPLHAQIAAIAQTEADARAAADAAEAERIANLPPPRWRVSKDTLVGRIPDASLDNVMAALASQSAAEQFKFTQSAWFWSDNPQLRGLCTALGIDADALLAPDPFLS